MARATLKHSSLHYLLEGPAGAPVVVLSNSLGTDLTMWEGQLASLLQHFRVLRYDTRGHGQSSTPSDRTSLHDLGTDVIHLLDLLGIGRAHVCGISLGGITALWLAIHAPHRVASVIACNTAARIGSQDFWAARIEQVSAHGLASIVDASMERWFTPSFRESHPEAVEVMRNVFVQSDATGYRACCAALQDADLTASIASIAVPALVISGTYDPVTPPSQGRWLAATIPGAHHRDLNAAHLSNVEKPKLFSDAMLDFLQRYRPALALTSA